MYVYMIIRYVMFKDQKNFMKENNIRWERLLEYLTYSVYKNEVALMEIDTIV